MIFRSLTGKTLAVYLPMVLASVVAVFAIQSWNYHREQEQELIEQLRSLTAVQSTTLAQAVWEFDSESIESAINQIMKLPIMRDAVVRDETGTNIIAMGAWDKPPEKPAYRLARGSARARPVPEQRVVARDRLTGRGGPPLAREFNRPAS